MSPQKATDVPESEVSTTVKNFIASGAAIITATKQNDGGWTIVAA
jgi:hypothetical protein